MPTTIKYKGSTIAELEAGDIGTIACNGKEMESDLIVIAPDSEGGTGGGTSADERVKYVTFMNGATELISYPVIVGDTVKNPATLGLIDTPTKEPTTSTVYTFSGWSLTEGGAADSAALANVTEDRIVYAAFTESARTYTINFYDGDTLVHTQQVSYGGSSSYEYYKDDYVFMGWLPEPTNVTADMDCYAQFEEGVDFAQASWAKIAEISESGNASKFFAIGDKKGSYVIVGFGMDVDENGNTLGITLALDGNTPTKYSSGLEDNWTLTNEYETLTGTIYNGLSSELKAVIKGAKKPYTAKVTGSTTPEIRYASPKLWSFDYQELFGTSSSWSYQLTKYPYFSSSNQRATGNVYFTRTMRFSSGRHTELFLITDSGNYQVASGSTSAYIRYGFCI